MKRHSTISFVALLGLITLTSCGADRNLSTIAGTVAVDGAPVQSGTIHFQSTAASNVSGGGGVANGAFSVSDQDGFPPGEYTVVLQAFRKTGRTINDPQKGKVEQTASVTLAEPAQTVTVGAEDAERLALDFATAK